MGKNADSLYEKLTMNEIEQGIYNVICSLGRYYTSVVLEQYDKYILERRDKKRFRNKGKCRTHINTIYGKVNYSRTIYIDTVGNTEEDRDSFVSLLDVALKYNKTSEQKMTDGLEKMINECLLKMSYRETSKYLSEHTTQTYSSTYVWDYVRSLSLKSEKDMIPTPTVNNKEFEKKIYDEIEKLFVTEKSDK